MHKDFRKGDEDSLLFIERKKSSMKNERNGTIHTGTEIEDGNYDVPLENIVSTISSKTEQFNAAGENTVK